MRSAASVSIIRGPSKPTSITVAPPSRSVGSIWLWPPAPFVNTYTAPWPACAETLWLTAPTAIVVPEIATALPSRAKLTPSDPVSSTCCTNGSTRTG